MLKRNLMATITASLGAAILAGTVVVGVKNTKTEKLATQHVIHTQDILYKTLLLSGAISRVERGGTGYLVRKSPKMLKMHLESVRQARDGIQQLEQMAAGDPFRLSHYKLISDQLTELLDIYSDAFPNARRNYKLDGATRLSVDKAEPVLPRVREEVQTLRQYDEAQLRAQKEMLAALQQEGSDVIKVFSILGAVLLSLSIATSLSAAKLRDTARREGEQKRREDNAREQTRLLTIVNKSGRNLVADFDLHEVVKRVTDAGVELTGAEFGAFFYHSQNDTKLDLFAISGPNAAAFKDITTPPRVTPLLAAHQHEVVRLADASLDDRYGSNSPHFGIPEGHPPIRSYLAVPVASHLGTSIGSILFGHSKPGIFTSDHEVAVQALASMAAVAVDNARLYASAQAEIAEKMVAEEKLIEASDRRKLLLDELNHRVKNTLATVQSIALQSKMSVERDERHHHDQSLDRFYDSFESRLHSLSATHDLLVKGSWAEIGLRETICAAIEPMLGERGTCVGPAIMLSPNTAVTLNMIFHELSTNAIKYGALSNEVGKVSIKWWDDKNNLFIDWIEQDGPQVEVPANLGFGSRLLKRGIEGEMGGSTKLSFEKEGLLCSMRIPLSEKVFLNTK